MNNKDAPKLLKDKPFIQIPSWEYEIIEHRTPSDLSKEVTARLNDRWELVGTPFIEPPTDRSISWFLQAVKRYNTK